MFKKIKMFLVALVLVPCLVFLPGCFQPEDPEDPPTTPTNTLTTAQKDEAIGKLKTIVTEDYSEKSDTATIVSTSVTNMDLVNVDFANSSVQDEQIQAMFKAGVEQMLERVVYTKTELGYSSDGTGYKINVIGENAESAVSDGLDYYFVKDGDKIVLYQGVYSLQPTYSASYVDAGHNKYDIVNEYLGSISDLVESTEESTSFEDFIDKMSSSSLEDTGTTVSPDNIDLDIDLTKENDIYTIAGTCTLTDVTTEIYGMQTNMSGVATYSLKFSDELLLEYGLDIDMDMSMVMPDAMFEVPGEGTFKVEVSNVSSESMIFTNTFDSTKVKTDFSAYEIGEIQNETKFVNFYIDGYNFTGEGFDYKEGFEKADITANVNGINMSAITWYTDEACTQEFTAFTNVKSYGEVLKLYAKNVAIPTGYACVIEKQTSSFFEFENITYRDVEYNGTYSFADDSEYDIYVTIDDGERTLYTQTTLTLEEGKTYLIEKIAKVTE